MTEAQFSELYREHYGLMFYWINSKVKNRAQAEDIAGRSFQKAWEHRADLKGDFKAWAYQIASNEMRSHWRSEKSRAQEPLEDHHDQADPRDFTQELEKYMEWQRANEAARMLDGIHRRALAMALLGLSTSEMGRRMHVPAGTAGSRVNAARAQMRELCPA